MISRPLLESIRKHGLGQSIAATTDEASLTLVCQALGFADRNALVQKLRQGSSFEALTLESKALAALKEIRHG